MYEIIHNIWLFHLVFGVLVFTSALHIYHHCKFVFFTILINFKHQNDNILCALHTLTRLFSVIDGLTLFSTRFARLWSFLPFRFTFIANCANNAKCVLVTILINFKKQNDKCSQWLGSSWRFDLVCSALCATFIISTLQIYLHCKFCEQCKMCFSDSHCTFCGALWAHFVNL